MQYLIRFRHVFRTGHRDRYFIICSTAHADNIPLNFFYKPQLYRQENCWSLRCSWSTASRRCPTTYSFSIQQLALIDWVKTIARQHETHLSFGIWWVLFWGFVGKHSTHSKHPTCPNLGWEVLLIVHEDKWDHPVLNKHLQAKWIWKYPPTLEFFYFNLRTFPWNLSVSVLRSACIRIPKLLLNGLLMCTSNNLNWFYYIPYIWHRHSGYYVMQIQFQHYDHAYMSHTCIANRCNMTIPNCLAWHHKLECIYAWYTQTMRHHLYYYVYS